LTDLDAVVRLMRSYYAEDGYPFEVESAARVVSDFLADPGLGRAWVMEADGLPVGYAVLAFGYSFEFGGRDAFVDELFVLPDHRGKGLGAAALEVIERACRELGVHALHLEVEPGKDRVVAFYERRGFRTQHSTWLTRVDSAA
jgi:GNAT superfamily N-acetyltransferase